MKKFKIIFWIVLAICIYAFGNAPVFTRISVTISSLMGLAFPYVLIIGLGITILSLLFGSRWAWLSIGACVLVYPNIQKIFVLNFPSFAEESGIEIISYNVKNFGIYGPVDERKDLRNQMVGQLADEQADIYCFQEFYTQTSGTFNNLEYCKKKLGTPYVYFSPLTRIGNQRWGLAIFSKFPIQIKESEKFKNSLLNGFQYAQIDLGKQKLPLLNLHLQSFAFNSKDMENMDIEQIQATEGKSAENVFKKFQKGYHARRKQLEEISSYLKKENIIIVGDFNSPPISETYQAFANFQDAFLEEGFGFNSTYNGRIPFLRIDYCFMDKSIQILDADVLLKHRESDHFPISVHFEMASKKGAE